MGTRPSAQTTRVVHFYLVETRPVMSQFFQRVATWLANEVVVKGLANNRAFQQFAVRTQSKIDNLKSEGVSKATEGIKNSEGVKNAQNIIQQSLADANKFGSMLADEVKKDLVRFTTEHSYVLASAISHPLLHISGKSCS